MGAFYNLLTLHIFLPHLGKLSLSDFCCFILSYKAKPLTTFCTSNLPLACSFSVRNAGKTLSAYQSPVCLSEPISRNSLTAQACSYVNRLAIGFSICNKLFRTSIISSTICISSISIKYSWLSLTCWRIYASKTSGFLSF